MVDRQGEGRAAAQVDLVQPAGEAAYEVAPVVGAEDQRVAIEDNQVVVARAADQRIGPGPADQAVVARVAEEHVVAVAAMKVVIAATAAERVVPGIADDRILAAVPVEQVVADPAPDEVIPEEAADEVVAAVAVERIVALLAEDPFEGAGPEIGLRRRAEVEARIAVLREDAATAPISDNEVALIEAILSVRETLPFALDHLRHIAMDMPSITAAVEGLAARAAALEARGIDIAALDFEAAYGRTHMEYYDGFVFGLYAEARPDLPPVASGGRYDALTRVLGRRVGRPDGMPAVGAVIRPGLVVELEGGA